MSDYLRDALAGPLLPIAGLAGASLAVQAVLDAAPLTEMAVAVMAALAVYAPLGWRLGLNAQDRAKALDYLRRARNRTLRGGRPRS